MLPRVYKKNHGLFVCLLHEEAVQLMGLLNTRYNLKINVYDSLLVHFYKVMIVKKRGAI